MLVDTHCHLHHPGYFEDPDGEVLRAHEAGVGRIVVVGVDPEDWPVALGFAERHEGVFAILGWHPNALENWDAARLRDLEELLKHPKALALGEIGLDNHHAFVPLAIQHDALTAQLDLAERLDLPVVFHAREAYTDLLDVLERRPKRLPYLFHCFTGSLPEAERAVALGATLGVDGPITYAKATALRELFAAVPLGRLVLETDAPYLAPVPHRGKPNRPAYIPLLAAELARARGLTSEEVAEATSANARAFFGLN